MEENESLSPAKKTGIDYAVKLAYTAADKSDIKNKRDVIYSLVCFGCMFDDSFAADPDPIVRKYDCLSYPEPQKLDLYELANTLIALEPIAADTKKELCAMWYMAFAYVILSESPHSDEIYDRLCETLQTREVFSDVLKSRYSVYIPATTEELKAQNAPAALIGWYAPYIDFCAERDESGVTNETNECKRLLAAGNFNEALLRSEKLLAAFPDDEQIAITDIAARVSLSGATNSTSRTALLRETLDLIDEYVQTAKGQYFKYYRGLTLLGLMDTAGARKEFNKCLEADPKFELAALMIKGMDKFKE